MSGNLDKKALLDFAVLLTKDALRKLATKATLSASNKFERKIRGKGLAKAGKVFPYLFQMKIWIILLKS